jgi:FkbM family methyltransferase
MARVFESCLPASAAKNVLFESRCGVKVWLDIGSRQFLFLSGRLPPEPLEVAVASRIIRQGDVFVDVGAHWGLYMLHVLGRLGPGGLYVAMEPSSKNVAFLRRISSRHPTKVRIVEAAAADWDGSGALVADHDGDLKAHLANAKEEGEEIRVCRVDSILGGSDLEKGQVVMKIDTEGMEAAVIRGCSHWYSNGIKPLFLLEFLPDVFKQTRDEILVAIEECFGVDYEYFGIEEAMGRLVRFDRSTMPPKSVRNILAVPPACRRRLDATVGMD